MSENLKFTDRCIPPFESGEYKISVSHKTNIDCKLSSESTSFFVTSERFNLGSNEVYSVYPPKDTEGIYEYCLPHITLHRRTLPWERDVFDDSKTPWLALLVFDEYEGVESKCSSCEDALIASDDVYIPKLVFQEYEDKNESCNYIDIPTSLFSSVIPSKVDLQYLAHGKGVNLDDKVTDSEVKSNWFSCVVANRYSRSPDVGEDSIQHTAYLVSLEGYREYLESEAKDKHPLHLMNKVRMFTLTNWKYTTARRNFNFAELFTNLQVDILKSRKTVENQKINDLINLGYYPLNHFFRDGSRLVSWYQPPFIPYIESKKSVKCHSYADELLIYDPDNSMFDVTYQSAWQLGRMMAIASQPYAKALFMWRVNNKNNFMMNKEKDILARNLYSIQTEDNFGLNRNKRDEVTFDYCLNQMLDDLVGEENYVADYAGVKNGKVSSIWRGDDND